MKKNILFLFIYLLSFSAWSAIEIKLQFADGEVKQGQIIEAQVTLDSNSSSMLPLQTLKAKEIGKTIYFVQLSPLIKSEGAEEYVSEAKVIFTNVPPDSNAVTDNVDGQEVLMSWNAIKVQPTQAEQGFIYGNFEVPDRKKLINWLLIVLPVLILGIIGFWATKRIKKRNSKKTQIKILKTQLIEARSYEDVVSIWKEKHKYFKHLPAVENPFRKFELIINKYQFKPTQTEAEIDEVLKAYKNFQDEIKETLNGI